MRVILVGRRVLVRLIQDFDAGDRSVVDDGLKCDVELALRCGFEMVEGLGDGMEAASLFVDIEVVEEDIAVADDSKYAASHSSDSGCSGAEIQLREVQDQRVLIARVDRNGVGEVIITLGRIESRIGGSSDDHLLLRGIASQIVGLGVPEVASFVGE